MNANRVTWISDLQRGGTPAKSSGAAGRRRARRSRFRIVIVGSAAALAVCVVVASCSRVNIDSVNFPFTLKKEMELSTPGGAVALAWSPDGSRIAAASDYGQTLTVWDSSGRQLKEMHRNGGGPILERSIAFANGSSELLFPPDGADENQALSIWGVDSGKVVGSVIGPAPSKAAGSNLARHFSTLDAAHLLAIQTSGSADAPGATNVAMYNTTNWQIFHGYYVDEGPTALSAFYNGSHIAVGSGSGVVTLLDASNVGDTRQFRAYEKSNFGEISIGAIAGSPDGSLVFVGANGGALTGPEAGTEQAANWSNSAVIAQVLRSSDGRRVGAFSPAVRSIWQAAWDPKGRFVAFVDDAGNLFLWRPMTSMLSYAKIKLPDKGFALAISPQGDRLAATAGTSILILRVSG